jgi:c-di-GMP-binding flagellar brake protein YcgR
MAMKLPEVVTNPQAGWSQERRWTRLKVDVRLKVFLTKDGRRSMTFGQGSDISEGGMAAYIPAELQIPDRIDLEVILPYCKAPIAITAEVRNRNGFRYGLEFLNMKAEDKEVLARSLKTLSLVQ